MNALAHSLSRTPGLLATIVLAWRRIALPRTTRTRHPATPRQPQQGNDTEIRRDLARDVPAWARRDLGLDPDRL